MTAKPFLKWAGGKTQLLGQFEDLFPEELRKEEINRYIEPFIGSGAVFFHIINTYKVKECYISDLNSSLIITYKVIKNNVEKLIKKLIDLQEKYLNSDDVIRREIFIERRSEFNKLVNEVTSYESDEAIEIAKDFIFLNRTCFNGLFRVNKKGEFNVPPGKYKNPKICDVENLRKVSEALQEVNIYVGDYSKCREYINDKTFVYFDPPYRPLSETSSFTSYSGEFGDKQQEELASFFREIDKNSKALLMLSNSDPQSVNENDKFFHKLYDGFNIRRVSARRNINSRSDKRGAITELVITNY